MSHVDEGTLHAYFDGELWTASGSLFSSVRCRFSRAARRASSRAMFAATTKSHPRVFSGR